MSESRMKWWPLLGLLLCVGLVACEGGEEKDKPGEIRPDAGVVPDAMDPDMDDADDVDDADEGDVPDTDMPEEPVEGSVVEEPRHCEPYAFTDREFEATIKWTSYGIPHITGSDIGNLAFGQAYSMSRDHLCTLADQIVAVRGERAKYHGAEYAGEDFTMKALRVYEDAECSIADLDEDILQGVQGYVAGYNKYLEDTGVDNLPETCAGADWVKPISELDLVAYYLLLSRFASGAALRGLMDTAPPGFDGKPAGPSPVMEPVKPKMGSNGWSIGRDRSASGRGMLVSNTHFPWEGPRRWYESHLTIPGELDVYGVSLIGVVGMNLGFNENIAWTHTVSDSVRFNFYKLTLDPEDPEVYMYDGERRQMSRREYTIEVKQDDGSLETVSKTFWRSHYGPIIDVQPIGWVPTLTMSFKDANENNTTIIEQFFRMGLATDLNSFKDVHENVHGIPWVNTMYTDREGNALYLDSTNVPDISEEGLAAWRTALESDFFTQVAWERGLFLFDGADPVFEWQDEDAQGRGTVPLSRSPQLQRTDYIYNANDSHWLTHPDELLEGYSPFFGPERTQRSPRTRMNLEMLTEVSEEGASGSDGKFTLDELEALVFNNRVYTAELLYSSVMALCMELGEVQYMIDGQEVPLQETCDVLANWDLRFDLESRGAVLWREMMGNLEVPENLEFWAVPFDADDALNTPRELADVNSDDFPLHPLMVSLGKSGAQMQDRMMSLDVPLGEVQFTKKGDEIIPIHGAFDREGAFNVMGYRGNNETLLPSIPRAPEVNPNTGLTEEGYLVNFGSSFVMVMEFGEEGPVARAITTYSQSSDPASPHFADQTRMFSQKQMRPVLFKAEDIDADPNLTTVEVSTSGDQ